MHFKFVIVLALKFALSLLFSKISRNNETSRYFFKLHLSAPTPNHNALIDLSTLMSVVRKAHHFLTLLR